MRLNLLLKISGQSTDHWPDPVIPSSYCGANRIGSIKRHESVLLMDMSRVRDQRDVVPKAISCH